MRARALSLLGSLLLLSACGDDAPATPDAGSTPDAGVEPAPEIDLGALGRVRGERGEGFQAFLGIPYAQPPVGDLRWRPPVPHEGWEGVHDGTRRGSACPQAALGLVASGEEDCLVLHVHTPDPRPENAPVMVWIHGGAFVFGEGLQLDGGTAGDILARRHGVVVVSMNYRLGAFGFLGSDALGSTGNEGFQDQQLALRWVRDHIAAFGGDPEQVTIVGESAGGLSVCLHMIAPESRGLFQRAITQSGLCDTTLPTRAEQTSLESTLATALGCEGASDVAACMRAADADTVRDASAFASDILDALSGAEARFWPSIDGTVVPDQVRARVLAGEVAEVPVIVGWTRDEGTLFVGLAERDGDTADEADYLRVTDSLAADQGLDPAAVRAAYPLESYEDPGAAIAAALGHAGIACPARRAARLFTTHGLDVRVYRFDYPDAYFQLSLPRALGAFHSAEIQYVFGHPARVGRREHLGDDLALHEAITDLWGRFVRTGDPGGDWPAFELEREPHLTLDRTISTGEGADREACALWDSSGS